MMPCGDMHQSFTNTLVLERLQSPSRDDDDDDDDDDDVRVLEWLRCTWPYYRTTWTWLVCCCNTALRSTAPTRKVKR